MTRGHGFRHNVVEKIRERDHNHCRRCQKMAPTGQVGLHSHHIVYKSQGGTNAIINGVTVCNECHAKIHSEGPHARDILQYMIKKMPEYLSWASAERGLEEDRAVAA